MITTDEKTSSHKPLRRLRPGWNKHGQHNLERCRKAEGRARTYAGDWRVRQRVVRLSRVEKTAHREQEGLVAGKARRAGVGGWIRERIVGFFRKTG